MVNDFLSPEICLSKLLKFAGVPRSTWYYSRKIKSLDKRLFNKGRSPPGYTINRDNSFIFDKDLLKILENYRSEIEFHNGGGYIKLTHYLKREHGLYVNKKKIYRICKENNLLLQRKKKLKKPWKTINAK